MITKQLLFEGERIFQAEGDGFVHWRPNVFAEPWDESELRAAAEALSEIADELYKRNSEWDEPSTCPRCACEWRDRTPLADGTRVCPACGKDFR